MKKSEALRLVRVAADEAVRASSHLGRRRPRAYFISHLVRDEETWRVEARFGNVFARRHIENRSCYTDVRVGSYRYDQVQDGGLSDNSREDESYSHVEFPVGATDDGVRHALWKLTDAHYREAVDMFLKKRADELTYVNRNLHLQSFEKRPPIVDYRFKSLPDVDLAQWTEFATRASARLKRYPQIKASSVTFEAAHLTRIFASSEGTQIIERVAHYLVECYVWLLSRRGDGIPWTVQTYVTDAGELPDAKAFDDQVDEKLALLHELSKAPNLQSFSGPVLLEPRPAGLLMHEALGHRLEGSRLLATGEGQTFRDSVGKRILPSFLSVRDDPRAERFEKRSLVGHYRYDDEGVEAESASLIERGVLKSFLTSRAAIRKGHRSNGHGRASRHERPISRMGVTIVESHDGLDDEALRARFLTEIRDQRVPFGVRILHADGGETTTEGYNFQAFLGEINLASRVYPDGREEWVRGINFVGTPLNAVRSIVAAGKRYEIDNAHCGAESGFVPVSTVSPALVVSRLELQSKADVRYAPYTYPIPWEPRARGDRAARGSRRRTRGGGRRKPQP
jgi:TldD protein